MKSIGRHIKRIALAGAAVAALYAAALGLNHLRNNRENDVKGYRHSVTRPDGAFGHTTFGHATFFYWDNEGRNNEGEYDYVSQHRLLSLLSRTISDGEVWIRNPNGGCSLRGEVDGVADKIFIERVGINGRRCYSLFREKDYDTHKPEFDEADRLLAETKERFKESLVELREKERVGRANRAEIEKDLKLLVEEKMNQLMLDRGYLPK